MATRLAYVCVGPWQWLPGWQVCVWTHNNGYQAGRCVCGPMAMATRLAGVCVDPWQWLPGWQVCVGPWQWLPLLLLYRNMASLSSYRQLVLMPNLSLTEMYSWRRESMLCSLRNFWRLTTIQSCNLQTYNNLIGCCNIYNRLIYKVVLWVVSVGAGCGVIVSPQVQLISTHSTRLKNTTT